MDRDIPSVPITTLAGVASLTDLLSEMPLPTPLPQTLSNKSLLFHPRVAEEAQNLLGTRDALLVPQLVQSLLQTSADHIELKDHYAGTEPRVDQQQSMPELLKAILEKNPTVFEGPQGDVSRASAWNHTSTTGPYGQTSPCGTRVTRHTPQGSPASPTSARLHLHHRPSTISEQLPLDARPSTSAHRPLGNRPVPPWTISTQQQLQLTTVNASLNCTDERSCNEENDVPLSTLPQPTNLANRDMKSRNMPQDFDRSLPGQRLQTVSTSYTHEETKQNHESHNQRIVSASEEYVDDARRAIATQNLPTRTQDNDTAYVSTPGRECFAQACANVDAASILVPRVDVNNHVARFSQSTDKPVDCERQDHMAKPMNARGPSPAQASDAPPAPAPAPRPAREASPRPNGERARASASAPSTAQPIVRLNRLSPEAQAMMQKSLSEFAENRPELASKLGIVPNDRSTGGSDSDEDETDSRRLFESKSSNKERDSKRSIKDGEETNSSDTFSTLVGSRRRTRVSTTVNSKEKESTETSIEVSKPKLRKVERRFVPVLEKLSVEELMETNTYARFNRSIESVLENIDDNVLSEKRDGDIYSEEPPINRYQLQDLCSEAAKLKNLGAMQMIPADRLIRLLSVLESSVRTGESVSPVADPDDSEDLRQMWMETAMERVMGAVDASLTCMYVMTSPNMSKRIYLEDVIDRVILFVKYQLHNTIFPSFDPIYRVDTKKKGPNVNNRKKRHQSTRQIRDKSIIQLYNKTHELVSLLAELLTMQTLTDTIVLHASSMGVSPFFVDNIGELQLSCLKLVTTIFTRYEKHRRLLLDDVLASIARLPSSKRGLRSYRLTSGSEEHIQMLTALVLQLIQCVVALPETLSVDKSAPTTEIGPKVDKDILIHNKYDVATKTAGTFLTVFLSKCGNRNEEIDYRPLFENFVQDLLTTVNKPEWPATELLLSLLGTMLVKNFSNKGVDAALRVASLDYLGVIAAKLRKDAVMSRCKVQTIDQMIKDIKTEENKDNDEDNSTLKETKFEDPEEERTHFLQRVLLDYLAVSGQKDQAHRYARHFYLAQWYRDAMVEKNRIASGGKHETHSKKKRRNRRGMDSEESEVSEPEENEEQDAEEPNARINTELYRNIEARKQFYISKIRPFQDNLSAGNRVQVLQTYIDYRSAELISQYLASKRSFSQSFDNYLKQILLVLRETSIAIRTKAMKCMTMIVEADPSVLARADMQIGVNHSLLDISTSVREAAVDLIGKFVLSRPELIDKYYDMLLARILDTGVSVRKRVIKILKDICIECPEFDKIPEICVKMIRRVNDEDGIRKLVMEVFQNMWFTPTPERPVLDTDALLRKVVNITDVVAASKDFGIEWFEMLLLSLFKPREDKDDATKVNTEPPRAILTACRQIVDCLIESVLRLEESMGGGGSSERLIACLATLYLFAKIRPELLVKHASTLQPYLSYKCQTRSDTQIITYVAKSLELVVPLIVHPSETFLAQLEEDLIKLIIQSDKETVASCIACLGSIVNNVTRNFKLIRDCFNKFYRNLCVYKINIEKDNSQPEVEKYKPWFRRAVFTVGLLLRHFDFTDVDVIKDLPNDIKNQVFNLLTYYLHLEDDDIQANTLKAIGFICVRHYEFMLLDDLKQFYHRMFADLSAPLTMKIDALHNIEIYLLEEENRMIKQDQEWAKRSKEENLKEMGDISSGMASTVIQLYLKEILQSFVHSNVKVRHVAMRVIQLILQQGLVHPVQIVPYLICMSTDYEKMISNCADKQLQDIEKKYPGFIHMKAQYGVRLSYQLQRILQTEDIVRGFRIKEQNEYPSALNGYLYSILRNTKQQRRAIAQSVLKQFDEQVRTSLSYMLYLADNLAYFPYQVQDEPLFIIHQIDIMISVSGTNLLQAFREGLIPLHGNEQTAVSALDDDDEEDEEELFTRMPEDTSLLNDCLTAAQGCLLLLVLKQHLKDVYGISDGKILQYSPTEMAKVYEKAVNRRSNSHFNPKATLAKLREGSPPSTLDEKGRKALISQYLDFKQLMLKLDPDDEDEDDGMPGTVKATITAIAPGQPQPDQPQPDQPTATPAEQCPLVLVKHIVSTDPPPTSTYVVTEAKSPSDVTKDSRPQVPKLVISNRRTLMATGDVTDVRRTPTTRTPRSPDKSRRHRQKRKRKKFVSSSGEDSENGFSDPDFLV